MEHGAPTFTMTDENGVETTFYILCTFDSAETGKSYMIFTDDSVDEDGGIRVAAACFDPEEEEIQLHPIQTEREWAMVEHALNQLQQETGELPEDGAEEA